MTDTPRSEASLHPRGAEPLERPSMPERPEGGIPGQNSNELPVLDTNHGGRLVVGECSSSVNPLILLTRSFTVSNRIPVSVSRNDNGTYNFKPSSGGLVSALAGCKVCTVGFSSVKAVPNCCHFAAEPTRLSLDWMARLVALVLFTV